MSQIWIVHRRERERAALERLAAEADAVSAAPADPRFDSAAPPGAVVLGLAGDWEAELEFAHRHARRLAAARWILVGAREDAEAARARFDLLCFDYLIYPPTRAALQTQLETAAPTGAPPLSERAWRDAVSERFSRWLAPLELPDLLRALDPRLADVPLLVRGEPGTGRGALLRYVHAFGGTAGGVLAYVACEADTGVEAIRAALARSAPTGGSAGPLCIWLDEVGRLAPARQRELAAWLEAGAPGAAPARRRRWLASADPADPPLADALAARLATLVVELPPLRERSGHLDAIARETAEAWAREHREVARRFDAGALAALRDYPWPGNLRELEGVLLATLTHTRADPIGAEALRLPGVAATADAEADRRVIAAAGPDLGLEPEPEADEPLEASRVGVLLPDEDEAEAPTGEDASLPPEDESLRRLASALSLQVRNPLATLRRFAELLPERFDDPEFRHRFAEMLREDVGRIDGLLGRVDQLGALDAPRREKVDLAALLEQLLEGRRGEFRARHLLVLKELDPGQSLALADPEHLRVAFEALLDKALSMVPERGDLYLAARRHESAEGESSTRVLLRFHDPAARDSRPASEHSLELLIAELLVRAQGGRLTLGASDAEERLLLVDLPAP